MTDKQTQILQLWKETVVLLGSFSDFEQRAIEQLEFNGEDDLMDFFIQAVRQQERERCSGLAESIRYCGSVQSMRERRDKVVEEILNPPILL